MLRSWDRPVLPKLGCAHACAVLRLKDDIRPDSFCNINNTHGRSVHAMAQTALPGAATYVHALPLAAMLYACAHARGIVCCHATQAACNCR